MSFLRLIYWSALIGGWAAFITWLLMEVPFRYLGIDEGKPYISALLAIVMATIVAVTIGGGVSLASGLTNPKLVNLAKRLVIGFIGGLLGGLLGSLIGACIFAVLQQVPVLGFISRVLGWTLIGLGIGVSEGLLDRDLKKVRNGVIGGGLGGFLAGLFFVPVSLIIGSPMSSRALGFVLLGLFLGLFIGLAQVLLKESWLTVEQGFRAGRQLILGKEQITMGTSEKSSLIFIAYGAKGVEPLHLKITRQETGGYVLEDNQSRTGTLLNGQPVTSPMLLNDGDSIQFGVNVVRFNERAKHGGQRLPEPSVPKPAAPPIPAGAIQTSAPATSAVQAPAPAPPPRPAPVPMPNAIQATPPKPTPPPAPPKPVESSCPICGKKITGVPGERRCVKCFVTF